MALEPDARHRPSAAAVLLVAPLPPPVTGRAAVSRRMHDEFAARGYRVAIVDIGRRGEGPLAAWLRRARTPLDLLAVVRALLRDRRLRIVYIAVDDGLGAYATALMGWAARLFGRLPVLHHHSFAYLDRPASRMRLVAWLAGGEALHLTNCRRMADCLRAAYPAARQVRSLSNAMMLAGGAAASPPGQPERPGRQPGPVVLGHLSNLCRAKGIEIIERTAQALQAQDVPFRLLLAGPVTDKAAAAVLERLREHGLPFEHLGPVYGAAKAAFLERLDLFLFPSIYPTETTALVLLEAAGAGTPFLALRRGCIEESFYSQGGFILDDEAAFCAKAVALGRAIGEGRLDWPALSRQALRCARERRQEAMLDLEGLFAEIAPAAPGHPAGPLTTGRTA